jgi:hypothetical protein
VLELIPDILDPAKLLFDLQQVNDIAGRILGCPAPKTIAQQVTDGLDEKFDCTFSQIWLVEPDQSALRTYPKTWVAYEGHRFLDSKTPSLSVSHRFKGFRISS